MHVLIIEDDLPLATQIGDSIEAAGDEPDFADEEALALRLCGMNRYDAIVLDNALPRSGAQTFCRQMQQSARRRMPVLALSSAPDEPPCRAEDAGPHAYVRMPVDPPALHAKIKTLIADSGDLSQLSAGELHIDLQDQSVYCGQVQVELAPISFRILELLIRAFPGVVTRAQIEKQIWDGKPPESDAALRGHIHRLRQLLERPTERQMIRTIHGIGYQLSTV